VEYDGTFAKVELTAALVAECEVLSEEGSGDSGSLLAGFQIQIQVKVVVADGIGDGIEQAVRDAGANPSSRAV